MKSVPLGREKKQVTTIGLGGEGILRTYGRLNEAKLVIEEALRQNISYFDCARVYSDSEVYYGATWENNPELRKNHIPDLQISLP